MSTALDDPNDRLRTVAYAYFEHNTERGMSARLLKKLDKEDGEFVRPALTRALAAYGDEATVKLALTALVLRGQDLYRSAVIEALGDYHAAYALAPIIEVAKRDGPLQEDAILAMGKLGDKRALEVLEGLQKTASRVRQPAVAASICLLGINCESHQKFVVDTVNFTIANSGFQDLLRAASRALGALAASGRQDAAAALLDAGIPAHDPGPLARGAGVRRRGAAEHAADDQAVDGADRRQGRGAPAARRVRHARRGLRGRAVLRDGAPDLLAGAGGIPERKVADALDPGAGVLRCGLQGVRRRHRRR